MLLVAAVIPFAGVTQSAATDAVNRTPSFSKVMTATDNKASSWVGVNGSTECYKYEAKDKATSHGSIQSDTSVWKMGTAPAGKTFSLLVLKSSTVNDVWNNPLPGAKYGTASGKDISHVIVCKKRATTTPPTTKPPTTTPPTTTLPETTPPEETTVPETTVPETTTPETTEPETTAPETTTPPVTDGSGDVNLVSPVCDGNVPYLTYEVTGAPQGATISIRWINPEGDDVVYSGQPQSGKVLWPGAVVSPEGDPLDWPGWRFESGKWIQGDEFDWTRPTVQVVFEIEGVDADSAAARNADVSVSVVGQGVAKLSKVSAAVSPVNQAITVAYPPASPECAADPSVSDVPEAGDTTEVLGTKNSNLPKTGGSFATQIALSLGLLALGGLLVALPKRFAGTAAREH